MNTGLKIALSGFGALVAVSVFMMAQAWYYQAHIGRTLDTELGFTHGSPYVRCGTEKREDFHD